MRIVFVTMPWASVEVPSLGLGILATKTRDSFPDADVSTVFGNIEYIDWLETRCALSRKEYTLFSDVLHLSGCGDWIFSAPMNGQPEWKVREFREAMKHLLSSNMLDLNVRLHMLSDEFISYLAERIVRLRPDIVGFTSTFMQNAASLAASRKIKELAPAVCTVFGGANCDEKQGAALHRNYPSVDYVVRGEGEVSFPLLLARIAAGQEPADVPGLCWRSAAGESVANPVNTRPLAPHDMVVPDYDDYLVRIAASKAASWAEPNLLIESARGCWWGAKHHCTFCGLNGASMEFRSKEPETFFKEILALAERYRILRFSIVDNILDMRYLSSLMPLLENSGYDFDFLVEIKSNLRIHQLKSLAAAGVSTVQPGIESLNSRVLNLMEKGVTGCQNVRLLRDAETTGITPAWNYLYGFPGERIADYEGVLRQMPALHHLMPPTSVTRIAIERFSPYFDRPELGFPDLRPAAHYQLIYDLRPSEIFDIAYLFDAPATGIPEDTADLLRAGVEAWRDAHSTSRLCYYDLGARIVVVNGRSGFDWRTADIEGPAEVAAFRILADPRTPAALERKLAAQGHRADELSALLAQWLAMGIVFTDSGHYVHLAAEGTSHELGRRLGQEGPQRGGHGEALEGRGA